MIPIVQAATIKERQRQHWNSVAPGWGAWFDWTRRSFLPLTMWLQHVARCWSTDACVLDVACGAGYPALDAAKVVLPAGRVIAVDISSEMIATAAHQATVHGIHNVEFQQMDAEELRFDDGTFDGLTNAYGLMFCTDPARAVAEAHRVLKTGGRIGVAVWDEPAKSPFFSVIRPLAAEFLGLPEPSTDDPHPFRLASNDALDRLLGHAGFRDVRVESIPMIFECTSSDDYVRMFADLSFKSRMASLTPKALARFGDSVAAALQPYSTDGRIHLVATSLCASATR
jgi:SAM-dependent methyltransferase